MEKNCKYRLVVVQYGQYGVVKLENEKEVLGEYVSLEDALMDAEGKFKMLELLQSSIDVLDGTPADFVNTVSGDGHANFTDHYFIEAVVSK